MSPITKALSKDNAIFEYATEYYYKHQYANLDEFRFTDSDYEDFKKFLKKTQFKFETETEVAFAKALQQAEKDDLKDEVSSIYSQLENTIEKAKNKELDDRQEEIQNLLIDEIVKRYFYRDGLYEYQLLNNKEIAEAVSILNDTKRYENTLK